MATPYITIGCPTTGGGQVISGNSVFLIDGIPVACVGDKATCPTHKVVATIVSGDPYMQIFGKSAARVNDSLSCGCKLLPQQNLVVQDNGGGSSQSAATTNTTAQDSFVEDKPKESREEYLMRCGLNPIARVVKLHDAAFNAHNSHKENNQSRVDYYLQTMLAVSTAQDKLA